MPMRAADVWGVRMLGRYLATSEGAVEASSVMRVCVTAARWADLVAGMSISATSWRAAWRWVSVMAVGVGAVPAVTAASWWA